MGDRALVVFILGGPGAGKGTQSLRIQEEFGFHHISAGDCLREEQRLRPDSKLGKMIQQNIKAGEIVPVEVTCQLLRNRMKSLGWEKGKYIIDGFPRSQNNLDGWYASSSEDTTVRMCLYFEAAEEVLSQRLLERGKHSGRIDDNLDTIKKRFKTFQTETRPIIEHFEEKGLCVRIDATGTPDEVWQRVEKGMREHFSAEELGKAAQNTQES